MELFLQRKYKLPTYTIGRLYSGNRYLCDTMEPTTRRLTGRSSLSDIAEAKRAGPTAIPEGRYRLLITRSPRFGRWLPLLLNVKGFSGIRIHAGNKPSDTQGCILPGYNTRKGYVLQSTTCLGMIMSLIQSALDKDKPAFIRIK